MFCPTSILPVDFMHSFTHVPSEHDQTYLACLVILKSVFLSSLLDSQSYHASYLLFLRLSILKRHGFYFCSNILLLDPPKIQNQSLSSVLTSQPFYDCLNYYKQLNEPRSTSTLLVPKC